MDMYPLVPAYAQRRAVNETDVCAFPKQCLFDKQGQEADQLSFKFHETVVQDNLRKEMAQMATDLFQIEMFQAAVARIMKQYHDQHDFSL